MLAELPATEVDNLCNILHTEWPRSIQGCNIPLMTMYALDSYENELEKVFSHFLDKYDKIVTLRSILKKHIPVVEKVIDAKTYKIIFPSDCLVFSTDIDRAKNVEISYPSDVEVKPLKKEHLKNIYEKQPQNIRYIFNLKEFENRFELNNEFAVGIFCKQTGRLLTRCMRSHDGSICLLHTVKEARGNGYAKLLLKHVSKKLAELSITPYTVVDVENEKSIKAVQGSGFHIVSHVMYAVTGDSDLLTHRKI